MASYLDLMVDLLLVRRLAPRHRNVGKRLVKSPRIHLRDTGLPHALLGIRTIDELAGHPKIGDSWEAFVVENVLAVAPDGTEASHFRTAAGAEIDLVLEFGSSTSATGSVRLRASKATATVRRRSVTPLISHPLKFSRINDLGRWRRVSLPEASPVAFPEVLT